MRRAPSYSDLADAVDLGSCALSLFLFGLVFSLIILHILHDIHTRSSFDLFCSFQTFHIVLFHCNKSNWCQKSEIVTPTPKQSKSQRRSHALLTDCAAKLFLFSLIPYICKVKQIQEIRDKRLDVIMVNGKCLLLECMIFHSFNSYFLHDTSSFKSALFFVELCA